jgi:serine/threonine-protein kinase RsbW
VHGGPPPDLGAADFEREIPSDPALVPALVIRALDFLREQGLTTRTVENKVALCMEEALQNAVTHGNKLDFRKKARIAIHVKGKSWSCVVSDQGAGFDPSTLKDPVQGDAAWEESGRGVYLINHYMDHAEYFNGGSTVVMTKQG